MKKISYLHHRFHPDIIKQAIWLYFRFTMSYRDIEELLAKRGIEVSYETVRRWALKFGTVSWSRIFEQSVKVYPILDSETNYDEETCLYISF